MTPTERGKRRRPLLFLIRHYVGGWIARVGDKIEGDYRFETISGPDFDGMYEARPVPASWPVQSWPGREGLNG